MLVLAKLNHFHIFYCELFYDYFSPLASSAAMSAAALAASALSDFRYLSRLSPSTLRNSASKLSSIARRSVKRIKKQMILRRNAFDEQ